MGLKVITDLLGWRPGWQAGLLALVAGATALPHVPDSASCAGGGTLIGSHCTCPPPAGCLGDHCVNGHQNGAVAVQVSGWSVTRCSDCRCGTPTPGESIESNGSLNVTTTTTKTTKLGSLRRATIATLLVINGHAFTPTMLWRIATFAQTCADRRTCVVHVNADLTAYHRGTAPHSANLVEEYIRRHKPALLGGWVHVHGWTSDAVKQHWPGLQVAIDALADTRYVNASVGWGFANEMMTFWWTQNLQADVRHGIRHVWLMESDVAYCGTDVTEVFRSHEGTCDADSDAGPGKGGCEDPDTDFLSVGGCFAARPEWYHRHDANPQFLQWVAPVHRQMSLNVMARFTHKMMAALVRAHLAGRHAFLEMEVCSVANMAGLTTGSMNWIARGDQHSVMKTTEELPTGSDPLSTLLDVGVFDGKLAGKIVPMVNRAPPGWMVATAASSSGSEAYERECAELRARMDDCCINGLSSGSSEEDGRCTPACTDVGTLFHPAKY